jgi:hypothetical protein
MGRPKGSKNTVTDSEVEEVAKKTTVVVKEVSTPKKEEKPLKKGDVYLLIVDGVEVYWSKSVAYVAFQRGSHDIEIPKGSPFIPPINSKCKGCG